MDKKIFLVAGVIIVLAAVIFLIRQTAKGPKLETFTGSFVTGYEGDFTKLTYALSYPEDAFSIASDGRKIILTEEPSGNTHEVEFFWNGAAGFSSTEEFWETRKSCRDNERADCAQALEELRLEGADDVIFFENEKEKWFVAKYKDYFITIKLVKPAEAVKKIVETLTIQTEPAPNPEEPMTSFKVYFFNEKIKPTENCDEVVAVERAVPYTQGVGRAALELLFRGPTREDLEEGYATNIPEGSKLNSLTIVDGEARADFNAATESGGGSCSMKARVTQITETLKQFPTVKSVKLSIEGRTGDIFQP